MSTSWFVMASIFIGCASGTLNEFFNATGELRGRRPTGPPLKKKVKNECNSVDYSDVTLYNFLYVTKCRPSNWKSFFEKDEVQKAVQEISAELENQLKTNKLEFSPKLEWVFRALDKVAPENIKVVILGQDPTPQPGIATGLAFSLQPDVDARKVPAVFNVLMELEREGFKTDLINGDLTPWVDQGVLLLNCALTVPLKKAGKHVPLQGAGEHVPLQGAGEHVQLWKPFTKLLITYIYKEASSSAWMVWGDKAKKHVKGVDFSKKHYRIPGGHPSATGGAYVNFLGGDYFKCANKFLERVKRGNIDWNLPGKEPITRQCPTFPKS